MSLRNQLRALSPGGTITSQTVHPVAFLADDAAMPVAKHNGILKYPVVFLASG